MRVIKCAIALYYIIHELKKIIDIALSLRIHSHLTEFPGPLQPQACVQGLVVSKMDPEGTEVSLLHRKTSQKT